MASLKSLVLRVEQYLKYQDYHAQNVYPYPEDQNVAEWVRDEAEPNGWTHFLQDNTSSVLSENQSKPTPKTEPASNESANQSKRVLTI